MSRHVVPYGVRFREDTNIEVFPAIEVFVFGTRGRGLRATFHIDSGASISILPLSDADALGVADSLGKQTLVRGISGDSLIGYHASVKFQIGSFRRFTVPLLFVRNVSVPRILGREGIFDRYGILFDEGQRRTGWFDDDERKVLNKILQD